MLTSIQQSLSAIFAATKHFKNSIGVDANKTPAQMFIPIVDDESCGYWAINKLPSKKELQGSAPYLMETVCSNYKQLQEKLHRFFPTAHNSAVRFNDDDGMGYWSARLNDDDGMGYWTARLNDDDGMGYWATKLNDCSVSGQWVTLFNKAHLY